LTDEAGWVSSEEKLLCHFLLDDGVAHRLNLCDRPVAFLRGFIVQDRKTGKITCKYRFHQPDGKSWYHIEATNAEDNNLAYFMDRLKPGLTMATKVFAIGAKKVTPEQSAMLDGAIHFFYPPDDGGDPDKTLQWLIEKDLVEIKGVKVAKTEKGEN
jgi:hypothetical protein